MQSNDVTKGIDCWHWHLAKRTEIHLSSQLKKQTGDLKTYLLARRHLVYEKGREDSDEISSRRLTTVALDIAKALAYLAELKYVHRSVTPCSIRPKAPLLQTIETFKFI